MEPGLERVKYVQSFLAWRLSDPSLLSSLEVGKHTCPQVLLGAPSSTRARKCLCKQPGMCLEAIGDYETFPPSKAQFPGERKIEQPRTWVPGSPTSLLPDKYSTRLGTGGDILTDHWDSNPPIPVIGALLVLTWGHITPASGFLTSQQAAVSTAKWRLHLGQKIGC